MEKYQPPAEKSSDFTSIQNSINSVDGETVAAYNLKDVWEQIKSVSDYGERAILEGQYDKRLQELAHNAIELTNPKGFVNYSEASLEELLPSEKLEGIVDALKRYPFADADIRTALLEEADRKMQGLQGFSS